MPVTFEEYKRLRGEGLSDDQIARFANGEKPSISSPETAQPEEPQIPEPAVDAPKEEWDAYYKKTVTPKTSTFGDAASQVGAGAVEGVESLPFGKKVLEFVPGGEEAMQFAREVKRPKNTLESLYRGAGSVAPTLPVLGVVGKGVQLASTLPKLSALAGPGLHMATTMGTYDAARSAANDEGNPLLEGAKGFLTGGVMGKLGQFMANVVPRQVPGAERLGSAIGAASAQAGIDQVFNPEKPTHEKLADAILGASLQASFPAKRNADYDSARRAQLMKATIGKTMRSINMRPSVAGGKTSKSFNESLDKLNTAWYNVWKNGKAAFSGKDNTPEDTQEVLDGISIAKGKEIENMKMAQAKSVIDSEEIKRKQQPVMTSVDVLENGQWVTKRVPALDKNGQEITRSVEVERVPKQIQTFVLDGNDLVKSLRSSLTQNKKLLEATGDYDIKAIRQRLSGLKDKSFTIDEVDGLLAELNKTYGKGTAQAKIDRALADTLRQKTEERLDSIGNSAGKEWRQARRNWGALRELEQHFLKIHAKQATSPWQSSIDQAEAGTKLAAGAQTALGIATKTPERAMLGGVELALSKYRSMQAAKSKNPMEKVKGMFKELNRQAELRTLNQEISDATEKAIPMAKQAVKSLPQPGNGIKDMSGYKEKLMKKVSEGSMSAKDALKEVERSKAVSISGKEKNYPPDSGAKMAAGVALSLQGVDKDRLKAVLGEAESEGLDGMRMTASAINNRGSLNGVYGKDAVVIKNSKAYRKEKNGMLRQIPDYAVKDAVQALRDAEKKDYAGGATHWEGKKFKTPSWAKAMEVATESKNQRYYRPKGGSRGKKGES